MSSRARAAPASLCWCVCGADACNAAPALAACVSAAARARATHNRRWRACCTRACVRCAWARGGQRVRHDTHRAPNLLTAMRRCLLARRWTPSAKFAARPCWRSTCGRPRRARRWRCVCWLQRHARCRGATRIRAVVSARSDSRARLSRQAVFHVGVAHRDAIAALLQGARRAAHALCSLCQRRMRSARAAAPHALARRAAAAPFCALFSHACRATQMPPPPAPRRHRHPSQAAPLSSCCGAS